jgi:AraC family transcriptional regulator
VYVESGAGFVETPGGRYAARAGDVALLDCRLPHRYFTQAGWELYWLHFEGNISARLYDMIVSRKGCVLAAGHRDDVRVSIIDIVQRVLDEGLPDEAILSAHLHTLLARLLPLSSRESVGGRLPDAVREAVSLIQSRHVERLLLPAIAQSVGLSPFHFARVFKIETGFTPHEFLIVTRLDRAKILLKTSSKSVKEVAFETGFRSEVSFVTTFKRRTGFTPTEFRRK